MSDSDALAGLLRGLDLEARPGDVFLGDPGGTRGGGRLFGGLVAAQSVVAAGRTAPERPLHSLHAYFLRPGAYGVPNPFEVDRVRDGGSFSTRRVTAIQEGEEIFLLAASFAVGEEGPEHQVEAPETEGPPESLPTWGELRARERGRGQRADRGRPIELRVARSGRDWSPGETPRQILWLRAAGALPEDPLLHSAALVYASDRAFLSTATIPARRAAPERPLRTASLDHSVWIHRAPRLSDWHVYEAESPVAHSARGLITGAIYDAAGRRVASVAQEGLIRRARPRTT